MLLSDLLEEYLDNPEMLVNVLTLLDATIKYIHNKGYYLIDFNPSKIILVTKTPNLSNYQGLIAPIDYDPKSNININIYQMAKIGLMAFNHVITNGNMNQEHYNFILENINKFNQNGNIPNDFYEYYEDLFLNGNINYLNDYLENKKKDEGRNNSIRKSLVTEAGRALSTNNLQLNQANDNNAFVNILFIASILAFIYLIGLFIYTFILK